MRRIGLSAMSPRHSVARGDRRVHDVQRSPRKLLLSFSIALAHRRAGWPSGWTRRTARTTGVRRGAGGHDRPAAGTPSRNWRTSTLATYTASDPRRFRFLDIRRLV